MRADPRVVAIEPKDPPPTRKKVAFIKRGSFSGINESLSRQLQACFPELEFYTLDVGYDLLKRHPAVLLVNWLHVLWIYGWAILTKGRPLGMCFYYTPYIARQIHRLIGEYLQPRANEFSFSLATQSLYNAKIGGVPHFIYTDHTHLANLRASGFNPEFLAVTEWIALERKIYQAADRIFVMGENTRLSLVEQYGEDPARIRCVFGGPNTPRTVLPLANNDYQNQTILFIGLEWERKGGPELVAAFLQLIIRVPNAQLRIVGASPHISHPQIEIIGQVKIDQIPSLIAEASVLCLPSRYEPYGIAVLEAFAQAIPAVVTQVGALAHIVLDQETGRVVPPGDPTALAEALEDLLLNPAKCRACGERAAAVASRHYTWRAVGEKIQADITSHLHESLTSHQ